MAILYNGYCRLSLTLLLLWFHLPCRRSTFPPHSSRVNDLIVSVDRGCNPREVEIPIFHASGVGHSRSRSPQTALNTHRMRSLGLLLSIVVYVVDVLAEMRGQATGTRTTMSRGGVGLPLARVRPFQFCISTCINIATKLMKSM